MYSLPNMKRCLPLLAVGSGLLASLFLTGCVTTKGGKGNAAKSDEALYLFDDGTGDLPAVDYASHETAANVNFTESEQVKPSKSKTNTKPTAAGATQYAANTPPPSPAYNGGNGGGGNLMDHGGSDVVSTPPAPVKAGSNYGNAYAESDSGGAQPVASEPKHSTASNNSSHHDDEDAPVKKKSSSKSSGSSGGGGTRTYVVKRGDTLGEIADRYNTTVSKLKDLNDMSGTRILIGQKLKVGGSGSVATATSGKKKSSATSSKSSGRKGASSHTVKSGDNLWDLSRQYGVTVTALKSANGLTSNNLSLGQKLKIP